MSESMIEYIGTPAGTKKKAKKQRAPIEYPDSLHSVQYAKFIDLLCEGEIEGLANTTYPLMSVYLDDVPIMNPDGTNNFGTGVQMQQRTGTQSQTYMDGFDAIEAEEGVGTRIKYGVPVVREISNANATSARVTIGFPSMVYQNPSTGDTSGTTVQIALALSTWDPNFYGQGSGGYGPFIDQSSGFAQFNLASTTSEGYPAVTSGSTPISANAYIKVTWTGDPASPNQLQTCTWKLQYRPAGGAWIDYTTVTSSGYGTEYSWGDEFSSGTTQTPPSSSNSYTIALYNNSYQYWWWYYAPSVAYEFRVVKLSATTGNYWGVQYPSNLALQTVGISGIADRMTSTLTVTGKTTSHYQRSYIIHLKNSENTPAVGPWQIRVSRLTADSTTQSVINETWFDSYTVITDTKLRYPNSAMIGMRLDAQQFDDIPKRGYDIKGLKVKIPSNYNPTTRVYTGVWDGNFITAWTNNPAWCFYDLITARRYGLGSYIPPELIDKWNLYEIGQYCDQMVPNGFGGTEPRFTCNIYFQTREEAYKVVNTMASIFRGMAYWATGNLMVAQDAPKSPVAIFNRSNVINGEFNYQGTSIKTRHTVCLVSWNDPTENYETKVEYVEDPEGIELYGINQTEIAAVGCTSRGQAHRVGKWLIYTERMESEVLTFKTGLDGLTIYPGAIIKTTDSVRAGSNRLGGRIMAGSTTTLLNLDAPYTRSDSNQVFTISIVLPNGTVESRTAVNSGVTTLSYVVPTTAFSDTPQTHSMWIMSEVNQMEELWRIISIKEVENTQAEISATSYRADKYAIVENDLEMEEHAISTIRALPPKPAYGSLSDIIYKSGASILTRLQASWVSVASAIRYSVRYRLAEGNWVILPETKATNLDIDNVTDLGFYTVRVYSINSLGRESSEYLEMTRTVLGKTVPPSAVTGFTATKAKTGIVLTWNDITDIDRDMFSITDVGTDTNTTPPGAAPAIKYEVSGTTFTIPVHTTGTHDYFIRAIDTTGNHSKTFASTSFTIAAPSTPSVTAAIVGTSVTATWNDCVTDHTISTYEVRRGNTWADSVAITTTNSLTAIVPANWVGSQKILVKAKDIAGNYSAAGEYALVISIPEAPVVSTSIVELDALISWTKPNSDLPIVSYEVRYGTSWGQDLKVGIITGNSLRIPAKGWTGIRNFYVAATDSSTNVGTPSTAAPLTVLIPATPTLTSTFEDTNVRLSWTDCKTTLTIDHYEVRRGASWDTATGPEAELGKSYTTSFVIPVNWNTTATFWVRAVDGNGNIGIPDDLVITVVGATVTAPNITFEKNEAVISWAAATGGSLPVVKYEIRTGSVAGDWAGATLVAQTSSRVLRVPANWIGEKVYWLASVDGVGTYSVNKLNGSGTIDIPNAPTLPPSPLNVVGLDATFDWITPSVHTLDIDYYEVRMGGVWSIGDVIGIVKSLGVSFPITWENTQTFWVHAVDVSGNIGPTVSSTLDITPPSTVLVNQLITGDKLELSWDAPSSILPIVEYDIRIGPTSWALSPPFVKQTGTTYLTPLDWAPGSQTFWVNAINSNGTSGTAGGETITIVIPAAPVINAAIVNKDLFELTWSKPAATLPILNYLIKYGPVGGTWGTATIVGNSNTNTISIKGSWNGARVYWVAAIDVNNNEGTPAQSSIIITPPAAPANFRQQTVDNNVLMYWDQVQGTMPTSSYELRKGVNWAGATLIGEKSGGFTTIFETAAGVFTYWIAAIDTAGNYGTPTSISATVNQPPDYILKSSIFSDLSGSLVNGVADSNGMAVPINSTESYQAHFTALRVATMAVNAAGTVYAVGDTFRLDTGTATIHAVGKVATISGGGATGPVTAVTLVSMGTYTVAPTVTGGATVATTGSGTGLTINTTTIGNWTTPQEQVTAGFPVYVQPNLSPATYTEVIDYGTTLASNKVTVTQTSTIITGTVTPTCMISISDNKLTTQAYSQSTTNITVTAAGTWVTGDYVTIDFTSGTAPDNTYRIATGGSGSFVVTSPNSTTTSGNCNVIGPWINYPDIWETYAQNFQFVKVHLTYTAATTTDLLLVTGLNIRLDSKLKTITTTLDCIANRASGVFTQSGTTVTLSSGVTGTWVAGRDVSIDSTGDSGTYSQSGTTITVTATGTWTTGHILSLKFTTGTTPPVDGNYTVVSGGSGSFTCTSAVSGSPTGNITIGRVPKNVYEIATGGTNTFTITSPNTNTVGGNITVDQDGTPFYMTDDGSPTGQGIFIDVDAVQVSASGTTPLIALYNFVDTPNPTICKVLLFDTAGVRQPGTASVTVRGF